MNLFKTKLPEYFPAEFDIESIEVFAIERQKHHTVIGYVRFGELQEWELPCSPEKHAELVARFTSKLKQNTPIVS